MRQYNAMLTLRHGPPVISMALPPCAGSGGATLARYTEQVLGAEYGKLDYWQFALRDLDAATYLSAVSALGAAMAAPMRSGPGGRVDLKIEFLRRLREGTLDEARQFLLLHFMETYLSLDTSERELVRMRRREAGNDAMDLIEVTWADRIRKQGMEQVRREDIAAPVRLRFAAVPDALAERIGAASGEDLGRLLARAAQAGSLGVVPPEREG